MSVKYIATLYDLAAVFENYAKNHRELKARGETYPETRFHDGAALAWTDAAYFLRNTTLVAGRANPYSNLVANLEPLDQEFEKDLHDNL